MIYKNWNDIYKHNAPKLLGICRRYISDISTAEDILHDLFIKAIEKSDTYKGEGTIEAWLCRIVVNTALSHIREQKNFKVILAEDIQSEETVENEKDIQNWNVSDFSQEELLDAIDQLPIHHKSVFNLYVIDNYSHIEISELLNITVNTSKSHLLRARKKIQQILVEKEKKRRRIAGVLIISNPTITMEKLFKEQFKNFKITPSKAFTIDSNKPQDRIFFDRINKRFHLSNYIFTANFFVCLAVSAFTFNIAKKSENKNATNHLNENKKIVYNNPKSQKILTTLASRNSNETTSSETISKKSVKEIKKSKIYNQKNIIISINQEREKKATTLVKQISDSIDLPKKPVIIKRKIIKRDTVYIEK